MKLAMLSPAYTTRWKDIPIEGSVKFLPCRESK
ncbi:DUF4113 domain-containing protein [Enterobacter sp. MALB-1]